jgi:hypothetical protein
MRNQAQARAGQRQTHNPTYVTVDEHGNMVIRNMQTGQDTDVGTGAKTDIPQTDLKLPTNVSTTLETIAKFAYASELKQINQHLEQIKAKCDALSDVKEFLDAKAASSGLQDAVTAFGLAADRYQKALEQRRQAYLQFGVDLDRYAQSQGKKDGPKKGHEKFATIMTVVGGVRETLATAKADREGFDSSGALVSWFEGISDAREQTPPKGTLTRGVEKFNVPQSEIEPVKTMVTNVGKFGANMKAVIDVFDPVEQQAATTMGALHQGAGGGPAGGTY